ncbi:MULTISPECIES: hypothetical protein [Enterococcus]|uniref:Transcriptional regulator n=1 Tax=Enterococcus mundtii TaxID=53346 RepID=A0A2S7RUF3_ENTMU|nr:hypothetical protein [Enterococcus mundtii]PQF23399.1 hypothetical protein CUS89_07470 [Enterococcus mundtii]
MVIEDFHEMVLIQMKRQDKTWKYLGELIGTSPTYAKQIVEGVQKGPKAQEYKRIIANDLQIVIVKGV